MHMDSIGLIQGLCGDFGGLSYGGYVGTFIEIV